MDYIETFRERLLQDEALQRSLHRQRDVITDVFVFMTTLRSLTQTERRKERRKDGKTAMKWNTLSLQTTVYLFVSLSSSASQSFNFHFLRSRGRWRSAGHSSAVHGASVHQSPSAHPPAAHCTVGWTPRRHRWQHVHQVLLPRSAHWRRNSCRSRQLWQPPACRTRSFRWCWAEGLAAGRMQGRPTLGRCQRRAPAGHRADLWPGGRCERAPWCRRVGWAGRPSARGSGRRSVLDRRRCRRGGDEPAGRVSAPARKSEDSAAGSPPRDWWLAEIDLRTERQQTMNQLILINTFDTCHQILIPACSC